MAGHKVEIDPRKMREYYERRELPVAEASFLLGVAEKTFRSRAREIGLKMRTSSEGCRIHGRRLRQSVVFLYQRENLGPEQIAARLKIGLVYTKWIMHQEFWPERVVGAPRIIPPIEELDKMKKEESLTDGQLAQIYGVKAQSIAVARLRSRRRRELTSSSSV